jgi:hypothetical protein
MPTQADAPGIPTGPQTTGRIKRVLIILLVLAAALGATYLTGRLQGGVEVKAANERVTAAEQARDEARGKVVQLEARRRLHLALLALDQRNFGIAESHLGVASALLAKSKQPASLAELHTALSAVKLRASEDLGSERKKIESIIQRFDQLVPPADVN